MTAPRDGTQERTLDPPDLSLSNAEMRECERAAEDGFEEMDERAREWLNEQLADTPADVRAIVRWALQPSHEQWALKAWIISLRDRYVSECAEEYWGDLIEQAKHAQEP